MLIWIGIGLGLAAGAGIAFWRAWGGIRAAERRLKEEFDRSQRSLEEGLIREKARDEQAFKERRIQQGREWRAWHGRLAEDEQHLVRREEEGDASGTFLAGREKAVNEIRSDCDRLRREIDQMRRAFADACAASGASLLDKAGWTHTEAARQYKDLIASEVKLEAEKRWQKRLERLTEHADEEAQRLVEIVIQRIRPDYTEEHPHSVFTTEDMGTAVKFLVSGSPFFDAFEQATGVKLEWREGEGVVILQCPNGLKRELARRTMRKFVGARDPQIERLGQMKADAEREADSEMRKTINWVLGRLRIGNVHPEVAKTLGKLKYRTSHAQNVLSHSYEVGFLGSMLSSEMGLNPKIGKRGSFMHDLGKAMDAEKDAGHAVIGGDFAAAHGEDEIVVNAIAGHHEDIERKSLYPIIAQVADAISGGRPGARRETTERFLERVDQLMAIGAAVPGLASYYAVHAGREFRVNVNASQVKDDQLQGICQQIAAEIEKGVPGPGVEIVVCRETKAVDYAR